MCVCVVCVYKGGIDPDLFENIVHSIVLLPDHFIYQRSIKFLDWRDAERWKKGRERERESERKKLVCCAFIPLAFILILQ